MEERITATDLARVTGKSRQWICKLCRDGRIPAERVGKFWMVDAMVELPIDPRGERRIAKRQRLDDLEQRRKLHRMAVDLEPAKTWRDNTRAELREDYTAKEIEVLDVILAGQHLDAKGAIWVRAKPGDKDSQLVRGVPIRCIGVIAGWTDDLARFFRTMGGILRIEDLAE